ncbi:hypothetical protein ACN6LL_001905, partial [Streptomyces violaceoruber]
MGPVSLPVGRRLLLQLLGATGAAAALQPAATGAAAALQPALGSPSAAAAASGAAPSVDPPDDVAATYHRVLLRHTRWSETQWDEAKGAYSDRNFGFAVVLGHAVLLTHGTFDEDAAGVDRE